ncbi:hypothetical protein Bpfe_012403 [Biomphalaria pfeifferi]|uniref:Uncharacterized protein n=1 Tax=Biomphalaria pfeifferi TaxID=112525 RepID=A0AAD8BNX3_BIOPF|nr:hypothetical protein Bpfe_012403 [Biomphalaria pfeifferi]
MTLGRAGMRADVLRYIQTAVDADTHTISPCSATLAYTLRVIGENRNGVIISCRKLTAPLGTDSVDLDITTSLLKSNSNTGTREHWIRSKNRTLTWTEIVPEFILQS